MRNSIFRLSARARARPIAASPSFCTVAFWAVLTAAWAQDASRPGRYPSEECPGPLFQKQVRIEQFTELKLPTRVLASVFKTR